MAVFTITINDQTGHFEHRCSEVSYIAKCLNIAAAELQRAEGNLASGGIIGMNPAGAANQSLGSWSYAASANLP
jgi:hypothetical protein